ncbi:HNH endonuclease family protein [Lignipirellula cremea]|uniref:HNH nuclease domain-containing protein n=1 Tax=Lignipirellula cremea TaxID=2528010 RepID=A0A518E3X5_9BACT|nr:hypothetical protein [Lignipirellula cremea]QDU98791.1 hypothetical protein Pla8534_66650 [Lignipirellula cremea]
MIRFSTTDTALHASIDAIAPTWRTRAQNRTAALANGTRTNITKMWSEIKKVYMDLQGPKCAFCEKWIEDQAIEQDVEHFRPKNRISRWRVPRKLRGEGITVSQPAIGTEDGYRLLAYHPFNYVTACKSCNSILKRDYFPIEGTRDSGNDNPRALGGERAFLIYPLGDLDDDPEQLIEFHGLSPQPRRPGFDRKRALVTIEIFKLDDPRTRKELLKDRAEFIEKLYFALKIRDDATSDAIDKGNATSAVARLTSTRSRYTNCLRCYERLWATNRAEARAIYKNIASFLRTTSP